MKQTRIIHRVFAALLLFLMIKIIPIIRQGKPRDASIPAIQFNNENIEVNIVVYSIVYKI